MVRKLFASIQTRLLGVFLINTLLTVAIVMVFNQQIRSRLVEEADNTLLVKAANIADRINEFHHSNKQTFSVGSKLPGLVEFLQASEEQRADDDFRQRTRITLDSFEVEPWDEFVIMSQAIIDRNGIIILDTDTSNIGTDESGQDYFRATLLGGSINVSPIQYRPNRGGIYYYYSIPLRENDAPTTVIGVLRIQISISMIQDIIFDSVRGENLEVALFDENYVRIVDTQHEDILFRSIASFSPEEIATLRSRYALPPLPDQDVSIPMPDLVETLENTHQDHVVSGSTALDADRDERLAIIRLDTAPWYLIVSQPANQYNQSVQQQTRGTLILAISLIIFALISSYFISRRITRPIRVLTAAASQVAEGSLHIQAPVTSNDEVGTLARTFNLMTAELETVHATLEERVERRTRELSEANERLQYEIAERKRYEKQALEFALEHERRRLLSDFIQKASHEFRTPLSVINVKSYIAKQFLPDETKQYMSVIEEQSKYIEGLVNRMVLMSRLDSGVPTPSEHLRIDDFMRTIYTGRTDAFQEKQALTYLDLQAADTWVAADPELLATAVQNILDNALKYADDPVEISIRTRIQNGTVFIIIEDNGNGIPAESQARVFERFFRVDEAHSTRGFGLGLPIAKRIVENIGGTIELESESGKGTTVTIKLASKPPIRDKIVS